MQYRTFIRSSKQIKAFCRKSRKTWWSTGFTRKAVVDNIFVQELTSLNTSIVAVDAGQLYPYTTCELMQTGLYMRWKHDTEISRFKPLQNKTRNFPRIVSSYFQRMRPDCKIESFCTTGRQKKLTASVLMGFVPNAKLSLLLWNAFITSVNVKEHAHFTLKKTVSLVLKGENLISW